MFQTLSWISSSRPHPTNQSCRWGFLPPWSEGGAAGTPRRRQLLENIWLKRRTKTETKFPNRLSR